MLCVDAVSRMLPGVLSDTACFTEESHFSGLLEYPQYTRPEVWRGRPVPEVLLSGHHGNIQKWRPGRGGEDHRENRPDLLRRWEKAGNKPLRAHTFPAFCPWLCAGAPRPVWRPGHRIWRCVQAPANKCFKKFQQ